MTMDLGLASSRSGLHPVLTGRGTDNLIDDCEEDEEGEGEEDEEDGRDHHGYSCSPAVTFAPAFAGLVKISDRDSQAPALAGGGFPFRLVLPGKPPPRNAPIAIRDQDMHSNGKYFAQIAQPFEVGAHNLPSVL
jgi:hypothetical protein